MNLVVLSPFDGLEIGNVITEAARVAEVLASANADKVVQVAAPPAPAKAPRDDK